MTQQRKLFSILVPTYNQAKYLGAALDSLIAQTETDWEAIVVNDGSTDETPALMEEYARRDCRIRTISKANGGTASALNTALENASGTWVCWLSSDDLFDPLKLETHRKWIALFPESRFFMTYFRILRQSSGECHEHGLWGPFPEPETQLMLLFYRNFVNGISICIERSFWNSAGFFDESLRYAQDYDMWLRLISRKSAILVTEWTCVSRSHSLQGSETFPQACTFDTAKAIIRFINANRFDSFFPVMSLSNRSDALKALTMALDIASRGEGFLYGIGMHPALLMRTVEWVFQASELRNIDFQRELENCLRGTLLYLSSIMTYTPAGFTMRLALAVSSRYAVDFSYNPIDHVGIARSYYYTAVSGSQEGNALKNYLESFEGHILEERRVESPFRSCFIIIENQDPAVTNKTQCLASEFVRSGCVTVIFMEGTFAWRFEGGVHILCASSRQRIKDMVNELELPDAVLTVSEQGEPFAEGRLISHCISAGEMLIQATETIFENIMNFQQKSVPVSTGNNIISRCLRKISAFMRFI